MGSFAEESGGIGRRDALRLGLGGGAALAGLPGVAAPASSGIPTQQAGVVPANARAAGGAWRRWLGRPEDHDLLYFNQESWAALEGSIDYELGIGRALAAQGRRVHWSVPVGGAHAYGEAASGARDALFRRMAAGILQATPDRLGRICIRLPWEFNMAGQSLAARDAAGRWDARPYVAAFRRIAGLFRAASPRFYFDWCPNIGEGGIDPARCYPGDDLVDVVSVDVYYRARFDDQGHADGGTAIFNYRRTQPFGLDWLVAFARRRGKLTGLSEWGVDSDAATGFMRLICAWIRAQGAALSHHTYWDRSDGGVDARLSGGRLPGIGAIYRDAFGPRV